MRGGTRCADRGVASVDHCSRDGGSAPEGATDLAAAAARDRCDPGWAGGYVKYSRQGTRIDVTFAAGRDAGRLVAQGALGEAAAVELVAEAAVEAGLSRQEARTVTRRGVRAGLAEVSSGA